MSKNTANHLHRYKKFNLAGFGKLPYWIYKCTKPACSHYIRCDQAKDVMCECNRCNEPMIIGKQVMSQKGGQPMTLPHCGSCTKKKKVVNAENVDAITAFLNRTPTET
jgi:hypothetical protein